MKLDRAEFFVGKNKAVKHIEYLAKSLDIEVPKHKDFSKGVILKNESKSFSLNFSEEVDQVVKTGRSNMLQTWFDANDRFLQPALEMWIDGGVSGVEFMMTSSLGSHTAQVSNFGVLEAPELALARDICFYHKQTCDLYNSRDMHGFSRSFRGFLHSCVALVDCFLFRYTFHIKEMNIDTSQYVNTLTLDSRTRIEDRLKAWVQTFAASVVDSFPSWKERSQFLELKAKRNEFTHPTVPSVSLEPKDVARYLNYGGSGVGGLLAKMRKESGASDKIGFIFQIQNLPKVSIAKAK